ncbi:MAG TPA: sugar ABC transporter permease [Geminicoccus sp.]|uniref:carbohydrate ABC transporter permease n=1 Tax=Geminicoccus sp. TaxID=2024832 RepID=UPI002B7CEFB6|nr:sugar ABC transporter permease [Geminicoccus sp.]HWL67741.1 sugar ABC transporter permease [Geminicoccus sp.]
MTAAIAQRDRWFGFAMTLPGLFALVLVVLFPILFTLWTSTSDFTLLKPSNDAFLGLSHYTQAFATPEFRHALSVTLAFVVAVVTLEFLVGFAVALALDKVEHGKAVYYVILLFPLLMNPVVVGLIWKMFLHPTLGIVNYVLSLVGIAPVDWLGVPDNAFWTVVAVDIWHQVSFMIVLLLAGLAALPKEPYEAARLEGAGTIRCFFWITLPLMRPVIVVTLLIRLIFAVKTYDIIYIMTRGGPGQATELVSYYIYRRAFVGLDVSQASAMAVILLLVVLALTAWLHRYMRSLAQ